MTWIRTPIASTPHPAGIARTSKLEVHLSRQVVESLKFERTGRIARATIDITKDDGTPVSAGIDLSRAELRQVLKTVSDLVDLMDREA